MPDGGFEWALVLVLGAQSPLMFDLFSGSERRRQGRRNPNVSMTT
jgi:hypothetical protein